MRRARLVTAWTVVGAGVLTGCAAAGDLPLVAVHHGADGTPQVTLAPCGEDGVGAAELRAFPPGAASGPGPDGPATPGGPMSESWMAAGSRHSTGAAAFPLFSPPASWAVRRWDGERRLLPGFRHTVRFRPPGSDAYAGVLAFTTEDLDGLAADEVWADGRAMSPAAFRRPAEDAC
ncbi:hypothetical protein VR43_36150 [Streptomyces sp. NRRL S-104]|uniref:hypothetical protein n=1 Tax=Streptomyces sp. NRRL S-104 TaxID=1609135 RepID=UPI0005F978DD|nr:hypothetical protein [Streptomyces sp. NRRL S-104]KJY16041.1 hypothetical protein VR43_36150 [Streptomyces sp. NRRL S-104]